MNLLVTSQAVLVGPEIEAHGDDCAGGGDGGGGGVGDGKAVVEESMKPG